ncbi:MAG: family 10 glycosylhydrolase [bacterium]
MKNIFRFLSLIMMLTFISLTSCREEASKAIEIKGVYGNPKPLWDKEYNLSDLGVNSIFVHRGSINQEMIDRARKEGLKVFSEFPTLNGKNYVEEHPEAWPVNSKGEKAEQASWFMGVCPTDPGFRKFRFNQLRELLANYELDGVWMDYVHWHAQFEEPEPILPETCFCDECLKNFSADAEIDIPEGATKEKARWILSNREEAWRDWRCRVIHDWAKKMKGIIEEQQPGTLLGVYHCPWNDEEFNGARRRILGLDYDMLKETIDIFSPMVYHVRMEREPEWVRENIEWHSGRLEVKYDSYPKLWPIVQAHNDPAIISPEEFKTVLNGGLAGKSTGVMMFTTRAVAEDSNKIRVMKELYTGFR